MVSVFNVTLPSFMTYYSKYLQNIVLHISQLNMLKKIRITFSIFSRYFFECYPFLHPVSNNPQTPVEEQLAITLYQFSYDGNVVSLQSVANWVGGGKGMVGLVTQWVMAAILRTEFMDEAVCFPTAEEKEAEKKWVHQHSCKGWHDGWCFMDGTLVPLSERPHWFSKSYFDQKN